MAKGLDIFNNDLFPEDAARKLLDSVSVTDDYIVKSQKAEYLDGDKTHIRNRGQTEFSLNALFKGASKRHKNKYTVTVGWFAGAHQYPESGEDVADVAAFQEYGGIAIAPNFSNRKKADPDNEQISVPPRPFMRPMVEEHGRKHLRDAAMGVLRAILRGTDPNKVMEEVGKRVKADLQQSIMDVYEPPLRPKTIARRRFLGDNIASDEKPLIDTGRMIDSIDIRVG